MLPYKFILVLLLFNSTSIYAHQDFWITKNFDKVKVRIKTGFDYEEINKAWIIGDLTNKLTKRLGYNDTVFIDFDHVYVGDFLPDYFISFDDGSIKESWNGGETIYVLKNKALVIREVSRKFDAAATLRLTEYAINNLVSIKNTQKRFEYNKNYCQWVINSIDPLLTRKIAFKNSSTIINEVLASRVYKPKAEQKGSGNISYFFENNKYHICFTDNKVKEIDLLIVDNIYQFDAISINEAIVFDTDSTFYFVQERSNPRTSKQWTIKNKNDYYRPYTIKKVDVNKVTLSFWDYGKDAYSEFERILVYHIKEEELDQNLSKNEK